jgi:protein-S-isoprenylcysteine O-methyltransferase Ste14
MELSTNARVVAFLLGLAGLVYASRASLVRPRSHGFYRFFAWVAILGLAALNIDVWFRAPFSWHQLVSWVLLFFAAFWVIAGALLLKLRGRADGTRDDVPLAFEKTTALVTTGVYRYVRHPMYSSLLFLAWGIFLKAPTWLGGLLALAATLSLVAAARIEEAENLRYFGEAYRAYMKQTKRFVPFFF